MNRHVEFEIMSEALAKLFEQTKHSLLGHLRICAEYRQLMEKKHGITKATGQDI